MRSLIVSDLHSNQEALAAVRQYVGKTRIARIYCLGDFVGYGGSPNEVLDVMRTMKGKKRYVRGNHDRVAMGVDDGADFNHAARAAALWTRERLNTKNLKFLASLPLGPVQDREILLCHGSPHDEDEYLFTEADAANVFAEFDSKLILFGHTHLPTVFTVDGDGLVEGSLVPGDTTIDIQEDLRYLVNPGSVGQPRDRNPLASFAIHDSRKGTIDFRRVPYDIAGAQRSILDAGLPKILAARLAYGY